MKKLLLSLGILFSSLLQAQDLVWPETLNSINTGVNHTLLLELTENITLNGNLVTEGTLLGVFYLDDSEELQCGGFETYTPGETMSFPSYGDDSTTDEKDGFNAGETFVWYIQIEGIDYPMTAAYTVGGLFIDVYQTNMMAMITSLTIEDTDEEVEGCTDDVYLEYNSAATLDDGSCETLIAEGCIDTEANNYNETANTACLNCCEYSILGCTEPTAFNYNPNATEDDGSCTDEAIGCTDQNYVEYNPEANTDTDPTSCITVAIFGCTVVIATNYNSEANVNDGSCILIIEGCTNDAYLEYNPEATVDDNSCQIVVIEGCTDSNYTEYFPPANTDNGTCETLINGGCTDANYTEYSAEANQDNGSCETLVIEGCTDENFLEYNPEANTDDGSCTSVSFSGCTDLLADNYNLLANLDDGTCEYLGCTDPTAYNYSEIANVNDGSCEAILTGCTNPNYLEFNPEANTNDGSCLTIIVYGCTEPMAFNYNVLANVDDGSCEAVLGGCMNELYVEYNPQANFDDNSCMTLIMEGCTDETAVNYNELATIDDGSCEFSLIVVTHSNIGGSTYEFNVDVLVWQDYTILWNIGGLSYSNNENVVYTFPVNGEYLVNVTVTNGLASIVEEITIVINIPGLSINELDDELIKSTYVDVLGRSCLKPKRGEFYIRANFYESGRVDRAKIYYCK
jgi:hypothetical protein